MNLAQTNLQLYRQMADATYSESEIVRVNEAYFLASECTATMFRGSGKPFVCHLVGTASALVWERCCVEVVTAALLHAVYQDRVGFPGAASLCDRRRVLRDRFGASCDALVFGYHEFELERVDRYDDAALRKRSEIVFIRLADELEDLYDCGLLMHGKKGDDISVNRSSAWRLAKKEQMLPELLRAARAVGANMLADAIRSWLGRSRDAAWPAGLRSGRYTTFGVE